MLNLRLLAALCPICTTCRVTPRLVHVAFSGNFFISTTSFLGFCPIQIFVQHWKGTTTEVEKVYCSWWLLKYECALLLQFQYDDWLADQTGSEHLETWRLKMYATAGQNRSDNPETYRDIWPDDDLREEALSSLRKLDTNRWFILLPLDFCAFCVLASILMST